MEAESSKIHPKKLKSFVRHVCVVAKKHNDRENARADLNKQVERIKKFSFKKKGINKELEELDRKISLVLEKEMKLSGIKQEESAASKKLMANIMENREKIGHITNSISDVKERLNNYIEIKTERERKINELENKIKAKINQKKNISLLKNKLKNLEAMYNKLKNKGIDVSRVSSRIEDLRLRLSF